VRPAQPKKTSKARRQAPAPAVEGTPPAGPFVEPRPLRPIGAAALQELREAIRTGRYPTDAAVRSGMERLLRRPD
jgi:hypothetical protein